MRAEHLLRGPSEGRAAGQHLVTDHAKRIDVGAMIKIGLRRSLFGRHVGRRAQRGAEARAGFAIGGIAYRLGDAEVGHHHVFAGDQDVLGLDVAVHDAGGMRVRQRIGHFRKKLGHVRKGNRIRPLQSLAQAVAFDEGHDVVKKAVRLAGIEHAQDVRMVQARGDANLVLEALGSERHRDLRLEHLDGDLAMVPDVLGEIDRSGAADAELAFESVLAGQGQGQALRNRVHAVPFPTRNWVEVSTGVGSRSGRKKTGSRPMARPCLLSTAANNF